MRFFEKNIDNLNAIRLAEGIYIINKNFSEEKKKYIKKRLLQKAKKD